MLKNMTSLGCLIFLAGLVLGFSGTAWAESKIAFACDLPSDICLINPDGSGLTNLTNTPNISEQSPSWSPDGTRIVFKIDLGNDPLADWWDGLWVMDSDGSNRQRIADPGVFQDWEHADPAWSPELPSHVAAISPFGQFIIVFLLGGAAALYLNQKRGSAGA